jgi:RluA family pseudouridine synthase
MSVYMERKPYSRISPADSGTRLLDWLSRRFTYLPTDAWLRMLAEGRIKVEGLSASADRILSSGEAVAFDPPRCEEPEVDALFTVAFEDEDFLIVDKSGNLPCHPGGRYFEHSLLRVLRKTYGELRIATRLDRETSGLVLLCKSASSAAFAHGLLADGRLRKDYLALAQGIFPERLYARGYLCSDASSLVRKKRRFSAGRGKPDGKQAEACATGFERIGCIDRSSAFSGSGPLSLIRARPITGKTHQIRATLCSLGFPIVGDKLYGSDESVFLRFIEGRLREEDLMRLMLPNQALHCSGLSFHDAGGRSIRASSAPRWGPPYNEFLSHVP